MSSDVMSKAFRATMPYRQPMPTDNRELMYNEALCARVHKLRNEREWTALQMATALDLPPDRYRKYEYRSPLPAYLMERFALIVGCDLEYLVTGKTTKAARPAESTDFREKRRA